MRAIMTAKMLVDGLGDGILPPAPAEVTGSNNAKRFGVCLVGSHSATKVVMTSVSPWRRTSIS